MPLFDVYTHRVYGPIGPAPSDWIQKLVHEGRISAPDPETALEAAKAAGVIAPIVETEPCGPWN